MSAAVAARCSVGTCRRPRWAKGYCLVHYQRLRLRGSTERTANHAYSISERFWRHVLIEDVLSDGCWTWHGTLAHNGYGSIHLWRPDVQGSTSRRAHRVAYELLVGPIPEGLTLDHLCRNRRCVNPAHLEPVTVGENVRRGLKGRRKLICKRGHDLDYSSGRGICRVCRNDGQRRRKAAARAAGHATAEPHERTEDLSVSSP